MLPVKRALQISLLLMVIVSGLLLGLSQENLSLSAIAIVGSLTGFIICDWKRWFQLHGFLANVASVLVVFPAMQGFIEGDGATKLICVSNLLVYLQIVLMFQEKNTRRNWQIMVLSLLQVVVAAIFNLEFEGGLLFVVYFSVSGLTMIFQSIHAANAGIIELNKDSAKRLGAADGKIKTSLAKRAGRGRVGKLIGGFKEYFGSENALTAGQKEPVVIFDAPNHQERTVPVIVRHLAYWLVASLTFAFVMFFFIPRNTDAWFGPMMAKTTATGMTRKVDLNQRGKIEPGGAQVFRVSIKQSLSGESLRINGPAYFRGMALSNLKIVDGKTTWTAPYDRIFPSHYSKFSEVAPGPRGVRQEFRLTATDDPMLFSMMPMHATPDTPPEIEFCFEISSLSRRRDRDQIEKTQYRYELMTLVGPNNTPLESWPYISPGMNVNEPLTQSPGDIEWLTLMDRERYPKVVAKAEELARGFDESNRFAMLRRMEQYFQTSGEFSYTLDFTDVAWNDAIDPVEDFFGRHKCGHCELYSSALVLMLRSRGIPARLVVGYYAGTYNEENNYYVVRDNDAHAWVEAYLRPEDCTEQMLRDGAAGAGGAWLRLDPTPASELIHDNADENAIELARSFWQEYVMGLDSTRTGITNRPSSSILGWMDLSGWSSRFESTAAEVNRRPLVRAVLIALGLLAVIFGGLRTMAGSFSGGKKKKRRVGMIRQLFGTALGLISPGLREWVIGADPKEVSTVFYKRLTGILAAAGHNRSPAQTHREFADEVSGHYAAHPDAGSISATIRNITELFYEVRFGEVKLPDERRESIMSSINELETGLKKQTAGLATGVENSGNETSG